MEKQIIHLQTVVNTVFGELDADGNVVKKYPINLELNRLDEALFQEAFKGLSNAKQELVKNTVQGKAE